MIRKRFAFYFLLTLDQQTLDSVSLGVTYNLKITCQEYAPENRPHAEEIQHHQWFNPSNIPYIRQRHERMSEQEINRTIAKYHGNNLCFKYKPNSFLPKPN